VIGAANGCAVGRHEANKKAREQQQMQNRSDGYGRDQSR
jgi:hypothetical protein